MLTKSWLTVSIILLLILTGSRLSASNLSSDAHEKAIKYLESKIAANPNDTISISKLGSLQLKKARKSADHLDYETAELTFRKLESANPNSLNAKVGLAYSLIGRHRFSEALGYARQAGNLNAESPEVWALIGDLHMAIGNLVEAEMAYRRLENDALTLQSLSRMAQIHAVRGQHELAKKTMLEAFEAGKLLGDPASNLAWCQTMLGDWALEHDRNQEARSHYELALEIDFENHVAQWRLAQIQRSEGKPEDAMEIMRGLIKQHKSVAYWIEMGRVQEALGKHEVAQKWFKKAEQDMLYDLDRGDIGHIRELVELWVETGKNPERAVELALRDLNETRHDQQAYVLVARAMKAAGRHEESIKYSRLALQCGCGQNPVMARQIKQILDDTR